MPNRDKTGPNGQGSKTGRGLGPCGEENRTENPYGYRRGRRGGSGAGRGINRRGEPGLRRRFLDKDSK